MSERMTDERFENLTGPLAIQDLDTLDDRLAKSSTGEWGFYRMRNEDGSKPTLKEMAENVADRIANSGGDEFYFISADFGNGVRAQVCDVGNGPTSERNAHFIATAHDSFPKVLAAYRELLAECRRARAEEDNLGRQNKFLVEEAERLASLLHDSVTDFIVSYKPPCIQDIAQVLKIRLESDARRLRAAEARAVDVERLGVMAMMAESAFMSRFAVGDKLPFPLDACDISERNLERDGGELSFSPWRLEVVRELISRLALSPPAQATVDTSAKDTERDTARIRNDHDMMTKEPSNG